MRLCGSTRRGGPRRASSLRRWGAARRPAGTRSQRA
jgi:hypothetical protein